MSGHKPVTCPDVPDRRRQPQLTSSYGLVGPVTRSIAHDVSYVPTGGQTGRRPRSPLLFGKPGDLQVQPPLQPPSGGRGDRAGFEQPGQLGVLRGDEIALQLPLTCLRR